MSTVTLFDVLDAVTEAAASGKRLSFERPAKRAKILEHSLPIEWNVWEDDKSYHVAADLPGAQRDSLSVNVTDRVLEITARRDLLGYAEMQRQEQEKEKEEKQSKDEDKDNTARDGVMVTVNKTSEKETQQQQHRWHISERPVFGVFRRKLQLPDDADVDAIHAEFTDGVMRLRIKKRPEQHRKIPISFGV